MIDEIRDIINEINHIDKIENNTEIIHIYPDYETISNKIIPKKYSFGYVEKIKFLLNKKIDKNIKQTEYYFRDLVKTEINDDIYFFKKRIFFNNKKNKLILKIILNKINQNQFPNLLKHDHIEIKNMDLFEFESLNFIIIKYEKYCNIYLEIKNKTNLLNDFEKIFYLLKYCKDI